MFPILAPSLWKPYFTPAVVEPISRLCTILVPSSIWLLHDYKNIGWKISVNSKNEEVKKWHLYPGVVGDTHMIWDSRGIGNRKIFLFEVNLGYTKFYLAYGSKLVSDVLHHLNCNATDNVVCVFFNVLAGMWVHHMCILSVEVRRGHHICNWRCRQLWVAMCVPGIKSGSTIGVESTLN